MKNWKKSLAVVAVVSALVVPVAGCQSSDSDVVSKNLSKDADNYKIARQIVVYNAITDKYIQTVTGFCTLGNDDKIDRVTYTCKQGKGFLKDIITKSDNTIVFAHQISPAQASTKHVKVVFKPSTVLPDFEAR